MRTKSYYLEKFSIYRDQCYVDFRVLTPGEPALNLEKYIKAGETFKPDGYVYLTTGKNMQTGSHYPFEPYMVQKLQMFLGMSFIDNASGRISDQNEFGKTNTSGGEVGGEPQPSSGQGITITGNSTRDIEEQWWKIYNNYNHVKMSGWRIDWAPLNTSDKTTVKTYELAPPPAVLKEVCHYHNRQLGLEVPGVVFNKNNKEYAAQKKLVAIEAAKRKELAVLEFKRTLREWPLCKYGGKLFITWHKDKFRKVHFATWECSCCGEDK